MQQDTTARQDTISSNNNGQMNRLSLGPTVREVGRNGDLSSLDTHIHTKTQKHTTYIDSNHNIIQQPSPETQIYPTQQSPTNITIGAIGDCDWKEQEKRLNRLRHLKPLHRFTCSVCWQEFYSAYPRQKVCSPRTKSLKNGKPGGCSVYHYVNYEARRYDEKRWPDGQPLATWWNPDYLRRFRLRLGITQGQLAVLIGIHKNSVCRAERGIGVIKKPAALAKLDELRASQSGDDPQEVN